MEYTYVLKAFDAVLLRFVYLSEQCTMKDSSYTGNIPYMLVDVPLISFAKTFGQTLGTCLFSSCEFKGYVQRSKRANSSNRSKSSSIHFEPICTHQGNKSNVKPKYDMRLVYII